MFAASSSLEHVASAMLPDHAIVVDTLLFNVARLFRNPGQSFVRVRDGQFERQRWNARSFVRIQ